MILTWLMPLSSRIDVSIKIGTPGAGPWWQPAPPLFDGVFAVENAVFFLSRPMA